MLLTNACFIWYNMINKIYLRERMGRNRAEMRYIMLEEKTMSKKVRKASVSVLAISIEEKQKAISKKLSEYKAVKDQFLV